MFDWLCMLWTKRRPHGVVGRATELFRKNKHKAQLATVAAAFLEANSRKEDKCIPPGFWIALEGMAAETSHLAMKDQPISEPGPVMQDRPKMESGASSAAVNTAELAATDSVVPAKRAMKSESAAPAQRGLKRRAR